MSLTDSCDWYGLRRLTVTSEKWNHLETLQWSSCFHFKMFDKIALVGCFYFWGFLLEYPPPFPCSSCLNLSNSSEICKQPAVLKEILEYNEVLLSPGDWPAELQPLKAATGGISQPLETVSVSWVCSSAPSLFARADSSWVGLLSSQELRRGERAASHLLWGPSTPSVSLKEHNSFFSLSLCQGALPLATLTLGHFSTFPGLRPLSLRSMCAAYTYKEALGDRISRIRRDSHMSSSSNWYSKLYTFKCHQEREKEREACFAFQHLQERNSAFYWCLKLRG